MPQARASSTSIRLTIVAALAGCGGASQTAPSTEQAAPSGASATESQGSEASSTKTFREDALEVELTVPSSWDVDYRAKERMVVAMPVGKKGPADQPLLILRRLPMPRLRFEELRDRLPDAVGKTASLLLGTKTAEQVRLAPSETTLAGKRAAHTVMKLEFADGDPLELAAWAVPHGPDYFIVVAGYRSDGSKILETAEHHLEFYDAQSKAEAARLLCDRGAAAFEEGGTDALVALVDEKVSNADALVMWQALPGASSDTRPNFIRHFAQEAGREKCRLAELVAEPGSSLEL